MVITDALQTCKDLYERLCSWLKGAEQIKAESSSVNWDLQFAIFHWRKSQRVHPIWHHSNSSSAESDSDGIL